MNTCQSLSWFEIELFVQGCFDTIRRVVIRGAALGVLLAGKEVNDPASLISLLDQICNQPLSWTGARRRVVQGVGSRAQVSPTIFIVIIILGSRTQVSPTNYYYFYYFHSFPFVDSRSQRRPMKSCEYCNNEPHQWHWFNSFVCVWCVCACNFYNTSSQSLIHQTTSYAVMRDCWLAEPGLRPSFSELAEKIASILSDGNKGVGHVLDDDIVSLSSFVMLVLLFVEPSCSRDGRRQQQEDNLEEKNDIKLRKAKKSLVPTWWSGLPSTYLIRPSLKHIWSGLHTFNIFDQAYFKNIWSDLPPIYLIRPTYLQYIWSDLPSTYLIRPTFNIFDQAYLQLRADEPYQQPCPTTFTLPR